MIIIMIIIETSMITLIIMIMVACYHQIASRNNSYRSIVDPNLETSRTPLAS